MAGAGDYILGCYEVREEGVTDCKMKKLRGGEHCLLLKVNGKLIEFFES